MTESQKHCFQWINYTSQCTKLKKLVFTNKIRDLKCDIVFLLLTKKISDDRGLTKPSSLFVYTIVVSWISREKCLLYFCRYDGQNRCWCSLSIYILFLFLPSTTVFYECHLTKYHISQWKMLLSSWVFEVREGDLIGRTMTKCVVGLFCPFLFTSHFIFLLNRF